MDLSAELNRMIALTEEGITRYLPPGDAQPSRLHTAMLYSMQAGGKRLRPALLLGAFELFKTPAASTAIPAAVSVECLHTYSLIHDDLPCMDNDDLRRGRPTAHKAFDEATALLAGDALLTHALALLAEAYAATPILSHSLIRELADAAGSRRLIGGQMQDLLAEKQPSSAEELTYIHLNKTAAMIEASLVMGGLCGGATLAQQHSLRRVGRHVGLAFQIIDDILDATADTATLGKTAGKDAKAGKTTFVSIHGLEKSREFADHESAAASQALSELPGDTAFLTALVASMSKRSK